MKTILLISTLLLASCSSTTPPPTAEQIAAYGAIIHNGIQDYKTIRSIEKTP